MKERRVEISCNKLFIAEEKAVSNVLDIEQLDICSIIISFLGYMTWYELIRILHCSSSKLVIEFVTIKFSILLDHCPPYPLKKP